MATILRNLTYQGIPIWRNIFVIQWASQILSGVLVVVLVSWFFVNIGNAIQERDIPYGFSFLSRAYQTPIGQHFLDYKSSDSFLYAFVVAATNTIVVSIVGVILATVLGIIVGISRMSGNWIMSKVALVYIEFFRNVPLLLHLFFWFYIVLALPPVRQGYVIAQRLYINNGGVSFPWPSPTNSGLAGTWIVAAVAAVIIGWVIRRWLARRERDTGVASYPLAVGCAAAVAVGAAAWLILSVAGGAAPFVISQPEPHGTFGRIAGGFTVPGGLIALLIGLVTYTSSFIAEIVRAGVQSVGRGQTEAARAVGDEYPARHNISPGAAGHRTPADQPMPKPHEKQQPGRRHRVFRPDECGQNDDSNHSGSVHIHPDYGGLSRDEPDFLFDRQPI